MGSATVIHGKFANNLFVPDAPPPPVEGRAELIVFPDRKVNREFQNLKIQLVFRFLICLEKRPFCEAERRLTPSLNPNAKHGMKNDLFGFRHHHPNA
jgi:hypothetical protein